MSIYILYGLKCSWFNVAKTRWPPPLFISRYIIHLLEPVELLHVLQWRAVARVEQGGQVTGHAHQQQLPVRTIRSYRVCSVTRLLTMSNFVQEKSNFGHKCHGGPWIPQI